MLFIMIPLVPIVLLGIHEGLNKCFLKGGKGGETQGKGKKWAFLL